MLNILEINDNFCDCLIRLFIFLGHIMNFIKILVPIIIIVMGSIDFIKAVIAQKDDEMKKSQSIFIKRLIYGIATFFVISIISFLIGLAGGDTNNRCFKCVANVNSKECDKDNIPVCRKESQTVETPKEESEDAPETPTTPNPTPETSIVEEPSDEWDCSNGSGPVEGCRAHFSGVFISDGTVCDGLYVEIKTLDGIGIPLILGNSHCNGANPVFFENDYTSDILGRGQYNDFNNSIPKAIETSFDSFAIDKNTKLIIYEKENFQGDILLSKEGPVVYYNKYRSHIAYDNNIEYWNNIFNNEFVGYGSIFAVENRLWTTWDLFTFEEGNPKTKGSFKICCKK